MSYWTPSGLRRTRAPRHTEDPAGGQQGPPGATVGGQPGSVVSWLPPLAQGFSPVDRRLVATQRPWSMCVTGNSQDREAAVNPVEHGTRSSQLPVDRQERALVARRRGLYGNGPQAHHAAQYGPSDWLTATSKDGCRGRSAHGHGSHTVHHTAWRSRPTCWYSTSGLMCCKGA
jgi:hypothetical protein